MDIAWNFQSEGTTPSYFVSPLFLRFSLSFWKVVAFLPFKISSSFCFARNGRQNARRCIHSPIQQTFFLHNNKNISIALVEVDEAVAYCTLMRSTNLQLINFQILSLSKVTNTYRRPNCFN